MKGFPSYPWNGGQRGSFAWKTNDLVDRGKTTSHGVSRFLDSTGHGGRPRGSGQLQPATVGWPARQGGRWVGRETQQPSAPRLALGRQRVSSGKWKGWGDPNEAVEGGGLLNDWLDNTQARMANNTYHFRTHVIDWFAHQNVMNWPSFWTKDSPSRWHIAVTNRITSRLTLQTNRKLNWTILCLAAHATLKSYFASLQC